MQTGIKNTLAQVITPGKSFHYAN